MYILRWNFRHKWDKSSVIIDALKKVAQEQGYKGRVYTSVFGDAQIITSELEFEDAASATLERDQWLSGNIETSFEPSEWNDVVTGLTVDLFHAENY